MPNGDTQSSARTNDLNALSADKGSENISNSQESDDIRYRSIGGNSGYVGYSMSKRAAQAREEGRYPKTDFKKVYNMPQRTLDALVEAGIIDNGEWHHTSKMGNRTTFYGWDLDDYALIYAENKKEIDELAKGEKPKNPYKLMKLNIPEGYWEYRRSLENEGLSYEDVDKKIAERFPELAAASENNRLYHEAEAEAQRGQQGTYKGLQDFFDKKLTEAAERVNDGITSAVNALAAELNTDVEIVNEVKDIPDVRKRGAKGWYENGRVYIVLPNATSVDDAVETVLHEVVGHKGLRALFGERFNEMLDNVFVAASKEVRKAILKRAIPMMATGKDALRVATEEYMAEQAERGFDDYSLFDKIKGWFKNLLNSLGFNVELSDNDIRYMLWRSYNLLKGNNTLAEIENIAMQARLGVGEYRARAPRAVSPTRSKGRALIAETDIAAIRDQYEATIRSGVYQSKEALQDSMQSLYEVQRMLETVNGGALHDGMNAYYLENALSSTNKAEMEAFARSYFKTIVGEIAKLHDDGLEYEAVYEYLMIKHGIERNREMAVKEAMTDKDGLNKNAYERWKQEKQAVWNENLPWEQTQRKLDALAKMYGANLKNDYSGLSSYFKGGDFFEQAYRHVMGLEQNHNTKGLHDAVRNATRYILQKQYDTT